MCDLSFSSQVGEKWYLCVIFAATLATCSLSVLPDVRASKTVRSLASDLERCCVFDLPAITDCSWDAGANTRRPCNVNSQYSDDGHLLECYYGLGPLPENRYPAPPQKVEAQPFTVKCLAKNSTESASTCSKYHNQYFNGLNITVELSPYTAIFTQGIMMSLYGTSPNTRHQYLRFCRTFEFQTSPGFKEYNGHIFYYDGFRWLEPETTYQLTVRTLPINDSHNPAVSFPVTVPSCKEVPHSYYCKIASLWQPQLLTVHPDVQAVNVTFDLAPDTYQFDKYCVTLKDVEYNVIQTKNIKPEQEHVIKKVVNGTNKSCVSTTLGGIEPGNYVLQLQPQPTDPVCVSALGFVGTCKKTDSPVFYVAGPTVGKTTAKLKDMTLVGETTTAPPYSTTPIRPRQNQGDLTQVGETPTAPPYATTPIRSGQNQIWLPILLGCIAGILALMLLFFMIHRSQKQEQPESSSSKWIWKFPVPMAGSYNATKQSQESLQKGLDLTGLKEEEYKRQKQEDGKDGEDPNVTTESKQRSPPEMEPLLLFDNHPLHQQLPTNFFRSGSCSTLGCYTAEFMQLMHPPSTTRSISSLGTIEASAFRGSQSGLQRSNSKPDLVNQWLEKCPMLSSQNQGKMKRLGNSCPDMKTLGEAVKSVDEGGC